MRLKLKKPTQVLNPAYNKQSLNSIQIETFVKELKHAFKQVDENQDEDYHKNIISDIFKNVYCKGRYFVNVDKKKDLVIKLGNTIEDQNGVILEFKKPPKGNIVNPEMISEGKANCKALQELVLYYLRERLQTNPNHNIKHLIVTNFYDWYIFDEKWFDENIFKNRELKKEYNDWLVVEKIKGTQFFYDYIAKKHLDKIEEDVPCTYINLSEYKEIVENDKDEELENLIDLYKVLSPEHLLSKAFNNDSNVLNKKFYTELLHIIGLEETGKIKKFISRKKIKDRDEGSLLENTISLLYRQNKHGDLNIEEQEERYFEIAMELSITWLNRILFIKLLEGQIRRYTIELNKDYNLLSEDNITDYDELDELFFDVLAIPELSRSPSVMKKYINSPVPYLNSSLFEPTEFETTYLGINQLKSRFAIPIHPDTVLKDSKGNELKGTKNTLHYLFIFLNSYDFTSDSKAKIQKISKSVINASVLGLIFEKINGYKDGSYFTPGYITQYMCQEVIGRVVLDKFNEKYNWECNNLEDLVDKIDYNDNLLRKEANEIIDSIKICDASVGSGHYLVSALNVLLSIKSKLKILSYNNGKRIRYIKVEVVNDELLIIDEEKEDLFEYKLNRKGSVIQESQELQEALFEEKRRIIENCLFGVDINPKSVSICRLRLWIELLKNSYYTEISQYKYLQTLPNIDINIKNGDSLVSHFAIDDKNDATLKDKKIICQLIEQYKEYAIKYKNLSDKSEKGEVKKQIKYIKSQFEKFTLASDKDYLEIKRKKNELIKIQSEIPFGDKDEKEKWQGKIYQLIQEIDKLEGDYNKKLKQVYANPFEWRFEFPEILDNEGNFEGFDVSIGNPPYGAELSEPSKIYLKSFYNDVHTRTIDTFNLFISRSFQLVKRCGYNCYIVPNNLLFQTEYEKTRALLTQKNKTIFAYNLGDNIFEDANVPTCIYLTQNVPNKSNNIHYKDYRSFIGDKSKLFNEDLSDIIASNDLLNIPGLVFGVNNKSANIIKKISNNSYLLDNIAEEVAYGVSTGGDKIFRISNENAKILGIEESLLHPVLVGGEINKYQIQYKNYSLIYIDKETNIDNYPKTKAYLENFKEVLESRSEVKAGIKPWYSLNRNRYPKLFIEPKIILRQTGDSIKAAFDKDGYYVIDSIMVIKLLSEFQLNLNFVLAILNSKMTNFVYQNLTQESGRVFAQVKPKNIRKLFIPKIDMEVQKFFIEKVNEINSNSELKEHNLTLIDQKIYEIYNFLPEEIEIINKY